MENTMIKEVQNYEIDEDLIVEQFLADSEEQFKSMTNSAYELHKKLFDNDYDFPFEHEGKTYTIQINNQDNKVAVTPNRYRLVDYRFDIHVDRYSLKYIITYGPANADRESNACTILAVYTSFKHLEHAVKMFINAINHRQSSFWFPNENISSH